MWVSKQASFQPRLLAFHRAKSLSFASTHIKPIGIQPGLWQPVYKTYGMTKLTTLASCSSLPSHISLLTCLACSQQVRKMLSLATLSPSE